MSAPTPASPGQFTDQRPPLSIEELCFSSSMSCLEGRLKLDPAIGPKTMHFVSKFITKTFEKSQNLKDVRESLSKSVEIWLWLSRCFDAAIPNLITRSLGPPPSPATQDIPEAPVIKNHAALKDDLQLLIKLMHIARNLLVVSEPEIPQDLCAAAQFDQMMFKTIDLCIEVTSRGHDGDSLVESDRQKLNDITELYKKLLVACLQMAHNWVAKNDRNRMSLWFAVCFEDGLPPEYVAASSTHDDSEADGEFREDIAKVQIQNWMERNSRLCDKARRLLVDYEANLASKAHPPGHLPSTSPLAWNWLPEGSVQVRADDIKDDCKIIPHWKEDEPDPFEQDRLYGRVSRELDAWWRHARDPNYDCWRVPMPTVEFARTRTTSCQTSFAERYAALAYQADDHDEDTTDENLLEEDLGEEDLQEDDIDDDEGDGEGPMSGLLTEVPNILDPRQIEPLHMIIKLCIVNDSGLGLTRAGENLQETRCRMFLAMMCGKSVLREMLVFLAVWEKSEDSLTFQLTKQIVEAIHHNALIPTAWQLLRIPKDIISPSQTVLLRLLNAMFRSRNANPPPPNSHDRLRDIKLLHFLFIRFRSRIVPECVALMHLQAQIRNENRDPADFPVDIWDMERAKDGLQRFLELLATVNELPETRAYLIEWEAAYELLALLKGLEAGVPKKALVDPPSRSSHRPSPNSSTAAQASEVDYDNDYDDSSDPPPPPMHDPAHKFPWAGIKGQILHILAGLLQPPPGRSSPGNPEVQAQIIRHNGIVSLLNCCAYDDHNRYARERVVMCLKWLMDGSDAANNFLRELVNAPAPPDLQPPAVPAEGSPPSDLGPVQTLRIDGIAGEVKVRVKAPGATPAPSATSAGAPSASSWTTAGTSSSSSGSSAGVSLPSMKYISSEARSSAGTINNPTLAPIQSSSSSSQGGVPASARARSEELLQDIIALADEAAKMAVGRRTDEEETEEEEEDFM